MPHVRRMLRWFDGGTDELVGEEPLQDAPVGELRRLFGRPDDDPMYACYEVMASQRDAVQRLVKHPIRLDCYAYFIEVDAAPVTHAGPSG